MEQSSILIVSDDAAFALAVKASWQNETAVPAFTLLGSDLCRDLDLDAFVIAVVGPVRAGSLPATLKALTSADKSVLLVCESIADARTVCPTCSRVLVLAQQEGWQETLIMLASEILRRQEATLRLRQLEHANALLQRQATLGSYVLESRHAVNNALTSILGNAELLLLDPQALPPGSRVQLETIRSMAVRIHEILARFTSIDKELSALERPVEQASDMHATQSGAVH